jgi:GNAT superfamily N-acetyltransferase
MVKIEIREATEKDLPEVLSLFKQPDVDQDVLSIKEAQSIFKRIRDYPNYKIYVAKSNHKIVGTFSLLVMDKLSHLGAKSGIVDDVMVRPDWQGKGIGKKMMQFAMHRCKKSGCYKLMLSSNIKRELAHQFYEKLGFEKHGYSFVVDIATDK